MEIDGKTALKRLRRGDVLRREYREGAAAYWFEAPYNEVPAAIAAELEAKIGKRYRLTPIGDGLFGAETSQSWRAEKKPKGAAA